MGQEDQRKTAKQVAPATRELTPLQANNEKLIGERENTIKEFGDATKKDEDTLQGGIARIQAVAAPLGSHASASMASQSPQTMPPQRVVEEKNINCQEMANLTSAVQ